MNDILIHKAIKRSILGHLMLCGLLSLSSTLQAATSAAPSDSQASYDYTLQNHSDQIKPIKNKAYLDIEDMPEDLGKIVKAISTHAQSDAPLSQLLAMVTYNPTTQYYGKYLFASHGLVADSLAQQKAHQHNYHLIKSPKGPLLWQVLSFLDQKSYLVIETLILPKDTQLCLPCRHMCMHFFDKKLPVHRAGCQGQSFPTTAAPASAIACFYSNRFTDQQRRLVISHIGGKAFPDPKKLITPQPPHDHHKLPSRPIQSFTTQNQLHMAMQLQFPIAAIKIILTSPQIAINALDSTRKTLLDYATQDSNLYHLLVRYNAKTSQQLTQGQALTPPLSTGHIARKSTEEDFPSPDQLLIPANGQCLYTTIIMGYLLPVRQEADEVEARIKQLFGNTLSYYLSELHQALQNLTHSYLHSDAFSVLVGAFMNRMQIKKGTWGGPQEIQTIATKLKINIQVHYPDPSNPTTLLPSNLTKPAQGDSSITLHIVRDKAHPAEVLTEEDKASTEDNSNYQQHYRLMYGGVGQFSDGKRGQHLKLRTGYFCQSWDSKSLISISTTFGKLFSHLTEAFVFVTLLICLFKFSTK